MAKQQSKFQRSASPLMTSCIEQRWTCKSTLLGVPSTRVRHGLRLWPHTALHCYCMVRNY